MLTQQEQLHYTMIWEYVGMCVCAYVYLYALNNHQSKAATTTVNHPSNQTADKPCHSHSLSSDSFCLHDKCVGRSPIAQENSEIEGCTIWKRQRCPAKKAKPTMMTENQSSPFWFFFGHNMLKHEWLEIQTTESCTALSDVTWATCDVKGSSWSS